MNIHTLLLASALTLIAFAPSGMGQELQDSGGAPSELETLLQDWSREAPTARDMRNFVRGLDDTELGLLFEMASIGVYPDGRRLPEKQRTLSLDLLCSLGIASLRPLLTTDEYASIERRRCVMTILSHIGTGRDLRLAIAAALLDDEAIEFELLDALSPCALAIMQRDLSSMRDVRSSALKAIHPEIAKALLRALAGTKTPEALQLLADSLGLNRELEATILQEMKGLLSAFPTQLANGFEVTLLPYLSDDDTYVRRAATMVAGATIEPDLANRLVELLEDDERGVREAAHWSLKQLSGHSLPANSNRWKAWLSGEARWFNQEWRQLHEDLASGERDRVVQAMSETCSHPLYRRQTSERVTLLLEHSDSLIRGAACSALRQLNFSADLLSITYLLDDSDPAVAHKALATLQSLTGKSLPPSIETWHDALTHNAVQ
ncbi:MAG: HEAT repeat protein [Planctomycetota bacterium]|jgi:HEAT repeat protein